MKISDLVTALNKIVQEHGDLEVKNSVYPRCNVEAKIRFKRIPKDKRQSPDMFYVDGGDNPEQKEEKILTIYYVNLTKVVLGERQRLLNSRREKVIMGVMIWQGTYGSGRIAGITKKK